LTRKLAVCNQRLIAHRNVIRASEIEIRSGAREMNKAKTPRSLRSDAAMNSVSEKFDGYSGRKVSAVAGLMAVASFSGAEAQQSPLPSVTVDAPVARPRPVASNPRFISAAIPDLVVYPASSLHMVTPVTRGLRVASFFWLQSMIRDAHARGLIFDLDTAIQALVERLGRDDPETVKLTGIYHNLIRYWAQV
jgi:hypothetical protein